MSGPSLLTIWQGENVFETLLKLKGIDHPAEASPNCIRGSFWCDNDVANLTHSTDHYDDAVHELTAIESPHVLDAEPTQLALIAPRPVPIDYIPHSSIAIVYDVLKRYLMTTNNPNVPTLKLPESGEAKETNQVVTTALNTLAKNVNNGRVSEFIDCYLAGDIVTVTTMMKDMPVSKWEHFIIQCGTITRDKWNVGA